MQKSDTIGELAKALCEVQKKLEGAKKDASNPFFKSSYATLASVWGASRDLLSTNGLSVVQTFSTGYENDKLIIETTLLHSSGEWISGSLLMKPVKEDPQGFGSAITYGRRYALAAIVGISPEDDDAEAATERKPAKRALPTKQPDLLINLDELKAMLKEVEMKNKDFIEYLFTKFGVKNAGSITATLAQLSGEQQTRLIVDLQEKLDATKIEQKEG